MIEIKPPLPTGVWLSVHGERAPDWLDISVGNVCRNDRGYGAIVRLMGDRAFVVDDLECGSVGWERRGFWFRVPLSALRDAGLSVRDQRFLGVI